MNGAQSDRPTWKEWIAMAVFAPICILIVLWFVGGMLDGIGQNVEQRSRCLKHATTGQDIARCH